VVTMSRTHCVPHPVRQLETEKETAPTTVGWSHEANVLAVAWFVSVARVALMHVCVGVCTV